MCNTFFYHSKTTLKVFWTQMVPSTENSFYFTFVRIFETSWSKVEQQRQRKRDYTMKYHLDENYSYLEKKEVLKPAWNIGNLDYEKLNNSNGGLRTANEQQTSNLGLVQNVIKVSQFRNITTTKSIFCNSWKEWQNGITAILFQCFLIGGALLADSTMRHFADVFIIVFLVFSPL